MKARLLHVLELSTGPIRVANTFRRDEKATATENFPDVQSSLKGRVWLHFEPKFVTDCKAHKTLAILFIFIEFFMQIDQPTV